MNLFVEPASIANGSLGKKLTLKVLCAQVAAERETFRGLEAGLFTQGFRQLKLDGKSQLTFWTPRRV
eukprot:1263113-Amphidinium_carterae.1